MDKMENPNSPLAQAKVASKQALGRVLLAGFGLAICVGVGLLVAGGASRGQAVTQVEPSAVDPCSAESLALEPQGCVAREAYLRSIRVLRTELVPQLQAISYNQWRPAQAVAIDELEHSALAAFDDADYEGAAHQVEAATAMAQELLNEVPGLLESALQAMVAAFNDDNSAGATQHLQQARWLKPDAELVREYGPRIAVLPEAIVLSRRAVVARVENRPAVELEALQELLRLDPQRTGLQPRINTIKRDNREALYTQAIAQAEQALAKRDPVAARRHMSLAAQQAPQRDLRFLLTRIEGVERSQALDRALAQAHTAAATDDWRGAHSAYRQALGIDSDHANARLGRDRAQAIITAQTQFRGYIAQPLRLASDRVEKFVRREIEQYADLLRDSPTLAALERQVQEYLRKAQLPVTVAVRSDGNTDVSVRRVGLVGKHRVKEIQLTPGRYEFEGRRRGYKSALVELEIPYGVSEIDVQVVADERI